MKLIRKSKLSLILCLIIQMLAVGVSARLVLNSENASGKSGISPTAWPADSQIARSLHLPTLVMLVHPHCPCSRASISELAILMTKEAGLLNAEVVYVKPKDFPDEWAQSDLWQSAATIPGVTVRVDDGTEARRFGSLTSGQVMVYSAQWELLFSGGITSSRGREGANDGLSSIRSLLAKGSADLNCTLVFGCLLFNDASSVQQRSIKDRPYVK